MVESMTMGNPPDEPHFRGYRTMGGALFVRGPGGAPLSARFDLYNHSPDGFEWGYGGSGPAQLALAILACVIHDDEMAVRFHQRYKVAVVGGLPKEGWFITVQSVRDWWVAAKAAELVEGRVDE